MEARCPFSGRQETVSICWFGGKSVSDCQSVGHKICLSAETLTVSYCVKSSGGASASQSVQLSSAALRKLGGQRCVCQVGVEVQVSVSLSPKQQE